MEEGWRQGWASKDVNSQPATQWLTAVSKYQCEIIRNTQGVYIKDPSSNMTKPLKISPEKRISAEEIMKHPWLQESQVIRQANALMATQLRDRKRLTWRWSWQEVQGGGASFCFQDSNMLWRTKYSKTVDNVNNYWVEVWNGQEKGVKKRGKQPYKTIIALSIGESYYHFIYEGTLKKTKEE